MIDISTVMDPAPGSALAAFLTLSGALAMVLSDEPRQGTVLDTLQLVRQAYRQQRETNRPLKVSTP
jgi:hypothetical protein